MTISKNKKQLKEDFQKQLSDYIGIFNEVVSTGSGDWVVKGFIDIARNIYTISLDTKVLSKIIEILLFPQICDFAKKYKYKVLLSKEQNSYPDISLIDNKNNKFALDLKSSYRKNKRSVNGMTLGAFTGYFRDRKSTKNISFPYDEYTGHYVLGVIYSRTEGAADQNGIYKLKDLVNITSVIRNFSFFVQEKYRIAAGSPGSGNTKNIGSVKNIHTLVNGNGPFAELGEKVFDDYWMYYLTKDMARALELKHPPYSNIEEYKNYKKLEK
jgi:hypothetical protein